MTITLKLHQIIQALEFISRSDLPQTDEQQLEVDVTFKRFADGELKVWLTSSPTATCKLEEATPELYVDECFNDYDPETTTFATLIDADEPLYDVLPAMTVEDIEEYLVSMHRA